MTADLTTAEYIAGTERTALGLAIADAGKALQLVDSVSPRDYAARHHAALHDLLAHMLRSGRVPDLVEVAMECARLGWGQYGGPDYVTAMCDRLPSGEQSMSAAIARLLDASARRRLLELGTAAQQLARGQWARMPDGEEARPDSGREAADLIAARLSDLPVLAEDEWSHGADAWDAENDAYERGEAPPVWPTGMAGIDERLNGGFTGGKLYIIGGRPGWGKTALATALAVALASGGHDIGYYPMEVVPGEWQSRVVAILSGVPLATVLRRHQPGACVTRDQWDSMLDARDRMRAMGLHALDAAHVSLGDVVSTTRRLRARHGTKVIFVDYLQRMRHGKASRHDLAIGETVVGLKNLARELNIAVVAMVQLNRGVDGRRGGRDASDWLTFQGIPRASDIREAGQIEQEADAILYPVHPVEETLELPHVTGEEAAVVWAKNRNGAPGIDRGWMWDGPGARYWDAPPCDLLP